MKIPERLKVGGHWYTVKYPHKFEERSDAWGAHSHGSRQIFIGEDNGSGEKRPASAIMVTFIHEMLHALDHIWGDGEIFNPTGQMIGEHRVSTLAEAIFQVLVDNGWLEIE